MSDHEGLDEAPDDVLWGRLGEAEGLNRAELLLELARRASSQNEAPTALALLQEAAQVAEAEDDLRMAAFALQRQGTILFGMGDFVESAVAYRTSAELSRALGRTDDQAFSLWGRADALRADRDWEGALDAAESCRSLAVAEDLPELAGDACLIQAKALYQLDREQEALAACAEGRDHYRAVGRAAKVGSIDDFAITVRLYLDDLDEALDLARSCHVLAVNTRSSEDDAYATRRLADVHLRRGELDEAMRRADEARELHRQADQLWGVARCDAIRGRVLRARGELERALEVFTEARAIFDATGADGDALASDADRAILLHHIGRFREAAAVNRQIIDALTGSELPFFTDLPWAVGRLADNELAAGEPQQALAVIDGWDWLWQSSDDHSRVSLLRILEVQAQALAAAGREEEAAAVAMAALDLTTESDVNGHTARLYEVRARWLLQSGDAQGRRDLAHAIALDLAFGAAERAAELSEYFLPDVESPRRGGSDKRAEHEDEPGAQPRAAAELGGQREP